MTNDRNKWRKSSNGWQRSAQRWEKMAGKLNRRNKKLNRVTRRQQVTINRIGTMRRDVGPHKVYVRRNRTVHIHPKTGRVWKISPRVVDVIRPWRTSITFAGFGGGTLGPQPFAQGGGDVTIDIGLYYGVKDDLGNEKFKLDWASLTFTTLFSYGKWADLSFIVGWSFHRTRRSLGFHWKLTLGGGLGLAAIGSDRFGVLGGLACAGEIGWFFGRAGIVLKGTYFERFTDRQLLLGLGIAFKI